MRSWLFRHRHHLRALYGLAPEPRLARRLEAARAAERTGREPDRTGQEDRGNDDPGLLVPQPRRRA